MFSFKEMKLIHYGDRESQAKAVFCYRDYNSCGLQEARTSNRYIFGVPEGWKDFKNGEDVYVQY